MKKVELITVVYAGDLANLYYHAKSLKKNWIDYNPAYFKWTIVVEDSILEGQTRLEHYVDNNYTIDWCKEHIVPIMIGWEVSVVSSPLTAAVDGWHRQMLCKLWAASNSTQDWVLILDAKNFLMTPTKFDDFFQDDKLLVCIHSERPLQKPHGTDHINACKLFGIDINNTVETWSTTPFIWKTQLVRDCLTVLNYKNYDVFAESQPITEIALYWVYAQNKLDWFPWSGTTVGQYGGCADEFCLSPQDMLQEIMNLSVNNYKFLTLHRFHATPQSTTMVSGFLKSRNIIDNKDIAFYKKTFLENIDTMRPSVTEFLKPKWDPKEITRNGRTIKFDRIVAYGCSFTAGTELAEFLVSPSTPIEEIDKIKRRDFAGLPKKFPHYTGVFNDDIQAIGRNLSWAKQIANNLKVGFVNKAFPGHGVQNMVYGIEKDLKNGFLTETDLIVVGITSADRWMFFEKDGNAQRVLFSYSHMWPSKQLHEDFVTYIANDYFNSYQWYNSIKYLDMLSDRIGGRILQCYLHSTFNELKKNKWNNLKSEFVDQFDEMQTFESIVEPNFALATGIDWDNETHGGWHPKIQFHTKYANHITNILTGKNNE